MRPRCRSLGWWLLALAACGSSRRSPRPTLLNVPPPQPPPTSEEVRLMPVDLRPNAPEPIETAPGTSLTSMARRALDGAQPAVIHCYELLLVQHPEAAGRIEVQLDLSRNGSVTRAHLDRSDEGAMDPMLPCLREVFAATRVQDVDPDGQYVSRVYTFSNPPLDQTLRTPVEITAPRVVRARRGAPATPAAPAPAAPEAGPGSLRLEEFTRGLTDNAALHACAPIALRRAGAPLTLRLTIEANGSVSQASLDGAARAPALSTCVVDAARASRFRPSGIVHRAQVPLVFRRAPRG